jgi:hypothetical protein
MYLLVYFPRCFTVDAGNTNGYGGARDVAAFHLILLVYQTLWTIEKITMIDVSFTRGQRF